MRNSSFKPIGTLIFIIIFGSIIIDNLLPLIMGIAVIVAIGMLSSKYSDKQTKTTYTRKKSTSTRRNISASDEARINVYLRKYFNTQNALRISDNISLMIHGSRYSNLSSLDVYESGRLVSGFDEFQNKYPSTYASIVKELHRLSLQPVEEDGDVFEAEVSEHKEETKTEKTQEVEKGSQYYIEQINTLNTNIPDEEITNGLYETTALLKQINDLETKLPDSKSKLDKLYEYYLPIMTSILKQYEKLQDAKTDPSYEQTKEKLIKTIHLINDAMKKIISNMTDEDFINLSADISTLEAVLKKDGLTGNTPFTQKGNKDA